jgi:hypothetical protein
LFKALLVEHQLIMKMKDANCGEGNASPYFSYWSLQSFVQNAADGWAAQDGK